MIGPVTPPVEFPTIFDEYGMFAYLAIALFIFLIVYFIAGIIKFFYKYYKLYTKVNFLCDEVENLNRGIKLILNKLDNDNNNKKE